MALASNGTLLYVAGQGAGANSRSEVLRVDRQGRTVPVDSTWSFIPSENGGTRLSPDGRRLALSVIANGREELWIKQLDRGPFVRLSLESSGLRPEWSPDGRYVYFFSQTNALSSGLRRHRADGSGSDEPILHATRATWELQQTRDSNLMVVRLGVPPTRDIYLFDRRKGTGDSAISPLIADDRYEENAVALSPDGRWLAYASNESGRYEVYVRPFPDVNAGRWQISAQGGQEPRWAHSGRELFYRRGDQKLVSVAVTPAPTFVPGEQRALFDVAAYQSNTAYSNYDVAPDDQHFIFLRQIRSVDSSAVTTAVLVQQWRPGLRTRSGGN
jgi:Tol biopolymer transport system component